MASHDQPAPAIGASITDQLTALQKDMAARLPEEARAVFAAEAAAMSAAGLPEGVAAPGAPMPDGPAPRRARRSDHS
jgi:hypothetical protein